MLVFGTRTEAIRIYSELKKQRFSPITWWENAADLKGDKGFGKNETRCSSHWDTLTTVVTALTCFDLQIPVGHAKAGLCTYNIYSPYPEEFNRRAVEIISKYNFAPT